MIAGLAQALTASPLGTLMRTSSWAYPAANVAHLFGLALLAGSILAVDLRLAGLWRRIPLAPLSAALTPLAVAGLVVFALSGCAMFAADADALVRSRVFGWKLAIVALATANALVFHWRARRGTAGPNTMRAAALLSILLWSTAIVLGRMIAYS